MKTTLMSLAIVAVLLSGCDLMMSSTPSRGVDAWIVTSANDQAVRDAIIRQSTMYPYHFINNSAELNWLGASDLAALVDHFHLYPGRLSIRRGSAPQPLYKARAAEVLDVLRAAGIDVDRITVVDLPAGGDGMPSEGVIVILEQSAPESDTDSDTDTSYTDADTDA